MQGEYDAQSSCPCPVPAMCHGLASLRPPSTHLVALGQQLAVGGPVDSDGPPGVLVGQELLLVLLLVLLVLLLPVLLLIVSSRGGGSRAVLGPPGWGGVARGRGNALTVIWQAPRGHKVQGCRVLVHGLDGD